MRAGWFAGLVDRSPTRWRASSSGTGSSSPTFPRGQEESSVRMAVRVAYLQAHSCRRPVPLCHRHGLPLPSPCYGHGLPLLWPLVIALQVTRLKIDQRHPRVRRRPDAGHPTQASASIGAFAVPTRDRSGRMHAHIARPRRSTHMITKPRSPNAHRRYTGVQGIRLSPTGSHVQGRAMSTGRQRVGAVSVLAGRVVR